MHRKTLVISLGYLKTLILKILYVHADTEHCCNQTYNHAQNITPQLTACKLKNSENCFKTESINEVL